MEIFLVREAFYILNSAPQVGLKQHEELKCVDCGTFTINLHGQHCHYISLFKEGYHDR